MEADRIKALFKSVSTFHKEHVIDSPIISLGSIFRPTLRRYQDQAVKWMLKREKETECLEANGHDVTLPIGGILADEMGLGKTVEMLACILSNPCAECEEADLRKVNRKRKSDVLSDSEEEVEVVPQPKKRTTKVGQNSNVKTSGINSNKYAALRREYEARLSEMSCSRYSKKKSSNVLPRPKNSIQCFCDDSDSDSLELVQCECCGVWQHAVCLGIENGYTFGNVKCPQCWSKSDVVPAKATLIITPASILDQWLQEIKKHVVSSDFKCFVYNGVRNHKYIQPPTLAGYDVVLTTYNVLCSELNYLLNNNFRSLRHAKKYYSPTTPLTCLNWWRICLDEAQMVEGYTTKTASMAAQLNARCRWAVTGTPIQKSIQDLYGLIVFLHLEPFKDSDKWSELYTNDAELNKFIPHILWRSSKEEVCEELGVPPQSVLTHWLHFSPVEAYFYRTIHTECAASFRDRLYRYRDLNLKLSEIDRKELNTLMLPLLGVRQACTHPQVVRGKFVRFKHTMTMEDLMAQMVEKARLDADVAMRQLVSSLHGIAAINIIDSYWTEAAEIYRRVLHLSTEYKNSVKIDTLQMIHCLHNLAEVLEEHGAGIPPTLRDSELRNTAKSLEANYLQKYASKLKTSKDSLIKVSTLIEEQCKNYTLSYTGWWEDLINNYSFDEDDLMNRIKTDLDDNIIPGQQQLSVKLSGLHSVHREVSLWLANADSLREETLAALRNLETLPSNDLIDKALICHVNNDVKKRKGVKKCHICVTESLLKKYEAHIFSINKTNLNESFEDEEVPELINDNDKKRNEERELKEVKLFRTHKESSWKPTSQERILHILANFSKRINSKLGEEGSQHMAILENVRKEFKLIRAVWRSTSDQVYATDELYMAKLRLRLPVVEDDLSGNKKKKTDVFVLLPHDIPLTLLRLEEECIEAEAALKKTTGTLFYLQNIQKNGSTEQECPVCKEALTEKWSVLNCGHCCCFDCIPSLFKMFGHEIDCPLCRVKTPKDSVSYVQSRLANSDNSGPEIKGSHSTKVTAVVSELLTLLKEDPAVKILIFSTWEKVLNIIISALDQNNISYRRLDTREKFKTNLTQFKTGPVSVLLLPLKHGSKGLNLTEATHLFFVEPILNPAEELQAVGRIHRIGQTKPTFIHRFVVHNTIEERMISSLETSGADEWAKENVTLRKLNNLFILKEDNTDSGQPTTSETPIVIMDQEEN